MVTLYILAANQSKIIINALCTEKNCLMHVINSATFSSSFHTDVCKNIAVHYKCE